MDPILLEVIKGVIAVVAPILVILLVALMRKALQKAGLETNAATNELVEKYTKTGVEYVERIATQAIDKKLTGPEKSSLAVATIMGELKKSGITNVAEDFVKMKIESYLELKEPAKSKAAHTEAPKV